MISHGKRDNNKIHNTANLWGLLLVFDLIYETLIIVIVLIELFIGNVQQGQLMEFEFIDKTNTC